MLVCILSYTTDLRSQLGALAHQQVQNENEDQRAECPSDTPRISAALLAAGTSAGDFDLRQACTQHQHSTTPAFANRIRQSLLLPG